MRGIHGKGIAALAAGLILAWGCGTKDAREVVVATANGEEIRVKELREFLGVLGGVVALPEIPLEKKKEGLDRLVSGRLLALDARSRGVDNTDGYRDLLRQNERGVRVNALLRNELDTKLKLDDKEIKAEAAKLKGSDNGITESDAEGRARRAILERQIRKIEEEVIDMARKEIRPAVDQAMVERVLKGEKVPDDAVLATAGTEKVLLGEVRQTLQTLVRGGNANGTQDLTRNPSAMASVVNREMMGKALDAYAKSKGIEKSDAYKATLKDMERSVLISIAADSAIPKNLAVTDAEVNNAYVEHAQMFVREGKKIPLKEIRGQIEGFLMNEKRRKALDGYVAELKKKAKITVNEGVLPKV